MEKCLLIFRLSIFLTEHLKRHCFVRLQILNFLSDSSFVLYNESTDHVTQFRVKTEASNFNLG